MNRRSETTQLARFAAPWIGAALVLTTATGSAIILAELLMSPPPQELRTLAAYLTLSGAGTLAGGWLAMRAAGHLFPLTISAKAFLGGVLGSAVALVNVLILAQLMFISTDHDLKLLLAITAFSAVVTTSFALYIATTTAAGIRRVTSGIGSLADGRLHTRLRPTGSDELARLGQHIDMLAVKLEEAEDQRQSLDRERRELTTAISHDLRTPLSSIRAMIEALDDGVVDDREEVSRYYKATRREIERLSRMMDDLFELAQLDSGTPRLEFRRVRLYEIAAEVVDAMQATARLKQKKLSLLPFGSEHELMLDGARIERAVANLVRNALEHAPAGSGVRVGVTEVSGWLELSVTDCGDGVAAEDLPHIWDRFYRAEKSRRRGPLSDNGAGLGLAIVKGVVEAHNGKVHAEPAPGGGARFVIHLPKAS